MQLTAVLACVSLVISAAAAAPSDFTVVCYVDSATRRLFHHVSPSVCTYIIYTSAYIDENSSFKTASQDPNTGCTSIETLKERHSSLKSLLGVEVKQSRLEQLVQNEASLDAFMDATLKHLKEKKYDGLELTWVENTSPAESPRSTETLARFLKELKRQIGEDTELVNQSLVVSVSLSAHSDHTSAHSDEKAVSQFVDFISLLPSSVKEESQIDIAVKYWQDRGVDPKQLIMALPAFLWRSRRREHRRRFETETGTQEKEEQLYGPGLMIAKQVCKAIKNGQADLKTLTKLESPQSLGEEVSWLLQKGLGGVGVVALDVDNFADSMCLNCTESEKAILESKMISVPPSPHHHHHPRSHGPHSRYGHHRGPHHHHHDRDGREPHSQDDGSFDTNNTGHRHGYRHGRHHHEHHHGNNRHGNYHHGHGHHDGGHGGRGRHGSYGGHYDHGHHSSA